MKEEQNNHNKPKVVEIKYVVILVCVVLVGSLLIGGASVYLHQQSQMNAVKQDHANEMANLTKKVENLELSISKLEITDIAPNDDEDDEDKDSILDTKATISGSLGYPSSFLPAMKVCAVDTESYAEECVETVENQDTYVLSVEAGTYILYASPITTGEGEQKAYYTKCDTYDDSYIPECNSNAGDSQVDWHHMDFVCYEDETCKKAYTPLQLKVESQEKVELKKILQGWYIPCSYDTNKCNDPQFDVWSDYLN